jgi:hypothetical protein
MDSLNCSLHTIKNGVIKMFTKLMNDAISGAQKLTIPPGIVKRYVDAFIAVFKYDGVTTKMGVKGKESANINQHKLCERT